jgi:putative toxin-antitoxin system antitoxin component (TIGR02293 family)
MITKEKTNVDHYKALKEILGKNYIKSEIESPLDFITIASKGIDAHIISNFEEYFKFQREYVATLLNISVPTIYRWLKENKKLERNYSVQLFELTFLFLYGCDVFQSQTNFFQWLNLPNTALGGLEPKDLLDIPNGLSKVRDLLGRIEYGVYS